MGQPEVGLSRRQFLGTAAIAAGTTLVGPWGLRRAHGATTWTSPLAIDTTGATDVSLQLTDWLATTGQPGDIFKLRRGPGYAPGAYRIVRGVAIRRGIHLDLNGCWLYTGNDDGAVYPPVYDDHAVTPHHPWPRNRYCLSAIADGFRLFSSRPGARIQGSARQPHFWNNSYVSCEYFPDLEGQHAVKVGGEDNVVDLTNIALEFVHGDGVCVKSDSRSTLIFGRRVGWPAVFGLGGILSSENMWEPELHSYPGIHHVGRHGISTLDTVGLWIEGLSTWQVRRAIVDLEPVGAAHKVVGVIIRNTEAGFRVLMWLAAKGDAEVSNVLVEDNVSYTKLQVYAKHGTAHRRTNWTIRRNRGAGIFNSPSQCFELRNIDGLRIHDNYQLVSGVRPDMGLALYDCTEVSISPSTLEQFPLAPA